MNLIIMFTIVALFLVSFTFGVFISYKLYWNLKLREFYYKSDNIAQVFFDPQEQKSDEKFYVFLNIIKSITAFFVLFLVALIFINWVLS